MQAAPDSNDHEASAYNLNILWAIPTHIIAVFAFIRQPRWLKYYFLLTAISQLLLLGGWFFLPQQMNPALLPMVLALMIRAYLQYVLRKRGAYGRARIAKEMML